MSHWPELGHLPTLWPIPEEGEGVTMTDLDLFQLIPCGRGREGPNLPEIQVSLPTT